MLIEKLLEQHIAQDAVTFEALRSDIKEIRENVTAIRATVEKSRGFIGGVIFVVSALWAVVTLFGGKVVSWLST
ncbi:MAG: hypothetical protein A3E01_07110 [Gammaproteobacteria bacterium RIFCSPHIGHO2_12_FULL_63_22]|nr:MAG: hypothetical protein A3E01_07110 [Gammaproteobacteria bacterium RIFCSPHIGHO2_12_FULL_63_22]